MKGLGDACDGHGFPDHRLRGPVIRRVIVDKH
jgi:hypothetical protein